MLTIIILANIAAALAFLFGATYDFSSIIPRSERLNRLAAFGMAMTLAILVMTVLRSSAA